MNQESDPLETITGAIKLLANKYNISVIVNGNSNHGNGYFEGMTDRQLLDSILGSIAYEAFKNGKVEWLDRAIDSIHRYNELNSPEAIIHAWIKRND